MSESKATSLRKQKKKKTRQPKDLEPMAQAFFQGAVLPLKTPTENDKPSPPPTDRITTAEDKKT